MTRGSGEVLRLRSAAPAALWVPRGVPLAIGELERGVLHELLAVQDEGEPEEARARVDPPLSPLLLL